MRATLDEVHREERDTVRVLQRMKGDDSGMLECGEGFGFTLVEAAGNNDIDLLLGCSLVSVFVVLFTQLISDVGYAYLNPRIRVQ